MKNVVVFDTAHPNVHTHTKTNEWERKKEKKKNADLHLLLVLENCVVVNLAGKFIPYVSSVRTTYSNEPLDRYTVVSITKYVSYDWV